MKRFHYQSLVKKDPTAVTVSARVGKRVIEKETESFLSFELIFVLP